MGCRRNFRHFSNIGLVTTALKLAEKITKFQKSSKITQKNPKSDIFLYFFNQVPKSFQKWFKPLPWPKLIENVYFFWKIWHLRLEIQDFSVSRGVWDSPFPENSAFRDFFELDVSKILGGRKYFLSKFSFLTHEFKKKNYSKKKSDRP